MAGSESAGILLYRRQRGGGTRTEAAGDGTAIELFIVHPGGPFFSKRDEGVWSLPKGAPEEGESLEETALREFEEEVGFRPQGALIPLGSIRQKGGKTVHAFSCEYPAEAPVPDLHSNSFSMEWPPRSGKRQEFPEVDRGEFFDPEEAGRRLNPAQVELIGRLIDAIARSQKS